MKNKVINIVKKMVGEKATVELGSHLDLDLSIDSLDLLEIGMMLEEEFLVEVPDEDLYKWKTVEDIIDYIANKV